MCTRARRATRPAPLPSPCPDAQALDALRKLRTEKVHEARELKLKLDNTRTLKDGAQVQTRTAAAARVARPLEPPALRPALPRTNLRTGAATALPALHPCHAQRLRTDIEAGQESAAKQQTEINSLEAQSRVRGQGARGACCFVCPRPP